MDHLLRDRKKPKTINCHLGCIHAFYDYLIEDERMSLINPVRKNYKLRLPRPLPKHLRDEQVATLFKGIDDTRDRAMFMLMLRCGLRVEEVARLTADAIEYRRQTALCLQWQRQQGQGCLSQRRCSERLTGVYAETETL